MFLNTLDRPDFDALLQGSTTSNSLSFSSSERPYPHMVRASIETTLLNFDHESLLLEEVQGCGESWTKRLSAIRF